MLARWLGELGGSSVSPASCVLRAAEQAPWPPVLPFPGLLVGICTVRSLLPPTPSSSPPLAPTVLQEDVEKDDTDFVVSADVCIQQDGDNGSHGVLDFFPLSICAHCQVL